MKRVQALITYSLLGSVWLASCGGDNKKTAPPLADAGAAGEAGEPGGGAPSAGAGNRSGASGGPAPGEAGQAPIAGAAGAAGDGGNAGDTSLGGASGQGGAGGEGGALICFNELGQAGAANGVDVGTAGAGSTLHISYSCEAIRAAFAPSYDSATGNARLNVGALGASGIESSSFIAHYSYYTGIDGEQYHDVCHEGSGQVVEGSLVLPTEAPEAVTNVTISALEVHDHCGNDVVFTPLSETNSDFCYNLVFSAGEGGWQVDCYEGSCIPSCEVIEPPPATASNL